MCQGIAHHTLVLHLGNVGFAIPQIADQDLNDDMQDLSPYDLIITIVVLAAATNQTASLPAYILAPGDLARYYDRIAGSDLPPTEDI